MKKILLIILIFVIVVPSGWFLLNEYESSEPRIELELPSDYLRKSYEMGLSVYDQGTGLREVKVSIQQEGKEKTLFSRKYENSGLEGLFLGSGVTEDSFEIPVEFWKYGLSDGKATIRVYVSDYSWHGWNKGNRVYEEKEVVIDTKPPKISVLTKKHNMARGGTGLVIYRLYEKGLETGVRVGDNFFPAYSGMFEDEDVWACFFALDHTQGPGTEIFVSAEDKAGNVSKRGFYYYIRDDDYPTDVLKISDSFLERKMPEIDTDMDQDFEKFENPLLEKFLYVNGTLRKKNFQEILQPVSGTENSILWKGRFLRLPGSARRAGYADRRVYKYRGKNVDEAVHLGVDLASTRKADVPAANSGKVLLASNVGIYGNSVLIDHGFGLCTLYSHLTDFNVSEGDTVKRGEIVGTTGSTGFAGGDHLHFAVAVNNVFVNPVEWWDASWIENNITSKITRIGRQLR
ncbi:MAG: M23 family metallopeptidase [Thermodesulfobacteriota bacterium]